MDKSESSIKPEYLVEDVLSHFGTKGMRWGVRKSAADSGPQAVTIKDRPAGKKLKTSGGGQHGASEDAKNAAIYRQRAKKSSTDSLSTKELTDLVSRMNMEQQYETLRIKSKGGTDPRNSNGQKFAVKIVKEHGAELAIAGTSLALKRNPTVAGLGVALKIAKALAPKDIQKQMRADQHRQDQQNNKKK